LGKAKDAQKLTAKALSVKCTDYFAQCDELQRKPTWQGLAGYLNVTSETLSGWLQDEQGEVCTALKKVTDALSDRLQQRTDAMAMLSIKQPMFGGFLDRTRESGDGQISIHVTVGKGDEEVMAGFGR
jgi:hypothetical protein